MDSNNNKIPSSMPQSVQTALRVVDRLRLLGDENAEYISSVLPSLALSLEKQGMEVTEDYLLNEIEKGRDNLETLCQQFKRSAKQPSKTFNDIIQDLYKPLQDVLHAIENEDTDAFRKLYRRYGARLFTKDLKKDILAKAIELDKWKAVEYLIEEHNFRLEDHLLTIIYAIDESKNYFFIERMGEFYTGLKKHRTSSPFTDGIAPALLSFLIVDDPSLIVANDTAFALDVLQRHLRDNYRGKRKLKPFDLSFAVQRLHYIDYLIGKDTKTAFKNMLDSFSVLSIQKELMKKECQSDDEKLVCAMLYDQHYEFVLKTFDETVPGDRAHKLMFAYLFSPLNRLIEYKDLLQSEEEKKEFLTLLYTHASFFDIERLCDIMNSVTNEDYNALPFMSDILVLCSTRTVLNLMTEKNYAEDVERDINNPDSFFNKRKEMAPVIDLDIPLELFLNDYELNRGRENIREGSLKQVYSLFSKGEVPQKTLLSFLKVAFIGADKESFEFFYNQFSLTDETKQNLFHYIVDKFEKFADNTNDKNGCYEKRREMLSILHEDESLKSFAIDLPNISDRIKHPFFFKVLRERGVEIDYTKIFEGFFYNALHYNEMDCLGDLETFKQNYDFNFMLVRSIGSFSEEGPNFCYEFMKAYPVLDEEHYRTVHSFLRDEYLPRFTRYEELEVFDGYNGNKLINFLEDKLIGMNVDFEGIDAYKIARLSNGDESAWFKRWGKKAPKNLVEFSPYLFVPDLYEYAGKLLQLEENWDVFRSFRLNLLDCAHDMQGIVFAELPEGEKSKREFDRFAFVVAAFFKEEKYLIEYLDRWCQTSKRPVMGALERFSIPDNDRVHVQVAPGKFEPAEEGRMNWKDWRDAVLQCGPRMLSLVKYGHILPSPMRSDDGKRWSIERTIDALCPLLFDRYDACPELAKVTLHYGLSAHEYEQSLSLFEEVKANKHTSHIPDVSLSAEELGIANTCFYKLPVGDPRGLVLGHYLDCCQYITGGADYAARHGFQSPYGGFYVVEKQNGRKKEIVGASWGWLDENNVLVLDSLETLGGRVSAKDWHAICYLLSKEIENNEESPITKVVIGQGGATPVLPFPSLEAGELKPREGVKVQDSKRTYLAWERKDKSAGLHHV